MKKPKKKKMKNLSRSMPNIKKLHEWAPKSISIDLLYRDNNLKGKGLGLDNPMRDNNYFLENKKINILRDEDLEFEKILFKEIDLGGFNLKIAPLLTKNEIEESNSSKKLEKLFLKEYQEICEKLPFNTHLSSFQENQQNYPSSCKLQNFNKNRYKDVLCNEETRFLFDSKKSNESREENLLENLDTRYINANHVKGSHSNNSNFIATQAPLLSTLEDFYQMIWESKSKIIISLTSLVEKNKIKMNRFWPPQESNFTISCFTISTKKEKEIGKDLFLRKLEIKNLETNESRIIQQIHFTSWPDHGITKDLEILLQIYSLQKKYQEKGKKEDLNGPIVPLFFLYFCS